MKQIPNDSIKKWAYSNSNKLSHPVSVAAVCPACSLNVVFNTKRRLYDPNRDTSSCSSSCPACDETVHFWVVDMVAHTRQDGEGDPGVYMLPGAAEHMNIGEHETLIPESIVEYCKTAQDIYFSGNLMATNVLIKTALESIFYDFLPIGNSRTELSMMIRDSISTINKIDPLVQLSSLTKKQGDLHALFSNHNGTDKETADAMMTLLETLILYLYVMPARFRSLEERFAELNANSTTAETTPQAEQHIQGAEREDALTLKKDMDSVKNSAESEGTDNLSASSNSSHETNNANTSKSNTVINNGDNDSTDMNNRAA